MPPSRRPALGREKKSTERRNYYNIICIGAKGPNRHGISTMSLLERTWRRLPDKTVFMGDVCWPPAAIEAATFANNILFGAQHWAHTVYYSLASPTASTATKEKKKERKKTLTFGICGWRGAHSHHSRTLIYTWEVRWIFFSILHSKAMDQGVGTACQNISLDLILEVVYCRPFRFFMVYDMAPGLIIGCHKKRAPKCTTFFTLDSSLVFFSAEPNNIRRVVVTGPVGFHSLSLPSSPRLARPVLETVSVQAHGEIMGNDGQIYETIGILLQTAH